MWIRRAFFEIFTKRAEEYRSRFDADDISERGECVSGKNSSGRIHSDFFAVKTVRHARRIVTYGAHGTPFCGTAPPDCGDGIEHTRDKRQTVSISYQAHSSLRQIEVSDLSTVQSARGSFSVALT